MNGKPPLFNLILLDERWAQHASSWEKEMYLALEKAAEALGQDFSHKEVSIVLSEDQHVQNLNKMFREKDVPTNVLSFNSEIEEEVGDIILAYETVMKEAHESGISFLHHTLHLIIHGFLHLLGYDHEDEKDANQMESMEIQILKTLNINNPYEAL